ncbi:hypothetical protein ABGM91_03955 [Akkermansia muciniphila]|uniref:hypothetical protein n=1 Tax=Akkermansia muciniphila TaxID=239935 RepID=UPI0033A1FE6A
MNETECIANARNVPKRFWMKKAFIVLGGLLLISISINVMLWFKTMQEMHTSVSSVKEELEEVGLWAHAFQKKHGRLPSVKKQVEYGMKGTKYEGLNMTILEGKDGIYIGFEMKDNYKGVYDVSLHRVILGKETLEKWRQKDSK